MKFVARDACRAVKSLSEQFPALLVTGARQVGKTTLLRHLAGEERGFVTLDDPIARSLARNDPVTFLRTFPAPVIIDEIQYAPNLLPYIKIAVDGDPEAVGMYWLTGSQPFRLMRGVSESLAGRIAIFPIGGISQREECGWNNTPPFCPGLEKAPSGYESTKPTEIFERIFRGAFPALVSGRVRDVDAFYRSYVQTYLERDIRDLTRVSDESLFLGFLRVAAARTGQLLNLSEMARDVGISVPTAKAWLSLLETSGLVFLLHPFSRNLTSRIVKTPKLYFLDTGLASYLAGWPSAESLFAGTMSGAILETFVVSEIVKRAWNNGLEPRIWFYRDNAGVEVDLLIENAGRFHPIEVKRTASPSLSDAVAFEKVAKRGVPLAHGAIVCLATGSVPLSSDIDIVNAGMI